MAKSIKIEGYGVVMINPINIKEQDLEDVDPTGRKIERKTVGDRAKTIYVTEDGTEIPSSQICKKILVEDEELITPKFSQTKEVERDNVQESDDGSLIYRAIDRKFYNAVTDSPQILEKVIKDNKSLVFPLVVGNGWKIWRGILTNWNNKLLLVACRGDLQKELEKYSEETVELELEIIPQQKNMKKLVKAMALLD